jgi:conjugal transfer pilus assembly protein TraW
MCSSDAWRAAGFASALLLVSGAAAGRDDALDEILHRSQQTVTNAEAIAGEEAAAIRGNRPMAVEEAGAWLAGRPVGLGADRVGEADTAQQRAWNEVMGQAAAVESADGRGPPHPAVPDNVVYVFISLSMPDGAIRALFNEALRANDLPPPIFVLRGWKPPDLNALVSRLNALLPGARSLAELPNVQVNPTLFRDLEVSVAPTFVTKQPSGRWGRLTGMTSLADAIEKIRTDHYEGTTFGTTYPIEEPDILALIEQRLARVDWQPEVERVRSGIFKRSTGQPLPQAREDDSYLVDLTVSVNRDLAGPRGEVFAHQGETVNPFDYMTVQTRYVFFDANREAQRAVALEWVKQYPYTTLISTLPVEDATARAAVLGQMGQPIHEINPALINRFSLRAVPALAYQDGRMLRVDVHGIRAEE